ncbi:response regulator [Massilia sp. PAMC28688]|nr:response regulator [Massilia sp. PAMC28688]
MSVVLVDDNELTRAALRLMIAGDAYEIVGEAASGRAAIELILRLRPDIVCLDIQMPDINGLDVLESIKDAHPAMVVLMVTSSNDLPTIKRAISRGAAGFIVKPFTMGTVQDSMDKAAALRRRAPG